MKLKNIFLAITLSIFAAPTAFAMDQLPEQTPEDAANQVSEGRKRTANEAFDADDKINNEQGQAKRARVDVEIPTKIKLYNGIAILDIEDAIKIKLHDGTIMILDPEVAKLSKYFSNSTSHNMKEGIKVFELDPKYDIVIPTVCRLMQDIYQTKIQLQKQDISLFTDTLQRNLFVHILKKQATASIHNHFKQLAPNIQLILFECIDYLDIPALLTVAAKLMLEQLVTPEFLNQFTGTLDDYPILNRPKIQAKLLTKLKSFAETRYTLEWKKATIESHNCNIRSLQLSHDGNTLYSGLTDGTITIWDLSKNICTHTLNGHTDKVTSLQLSHDGATLYSGSSDKTIKAWDLHTNSCIATLEGHNGGINCLKLSHDGNTLYSGSDVGSEGGTINVWDLSSKNCTTTLSGHSEAIMSLQSSHDGNTLYCGTCDGSIEVWSLLTNKLIAILEHPFCCIYSLQLSHDGNTLYSGSEGGTIKVWNLFTNTCTATLECHVNINCLQLSHDGNTLYSGLTDKTINVWDLSANICTAILPSSAQINCLQLSHDGNTLYSGLSDGTINVWTSPFANMNFEEILQYLKAQLNANK